MINRHRNNVRLRTLDLTKLCAMLKILRRFTAAQNYRIVRSVVQPIRAGISRLCR